MLMDDEDDLFADESGKREEAPQEEAPQEVITQTSEDPVEEAEDTQ